MIDPHKIPPANEQSRAYREEFILFSIAVANKPAVLTAKKVDDFLQHFKLTRGGPFNKVRYMVKHGLLSMVLNEYRFGQYTRIEHAYREVVANVHPMRLTVEGLEAIKGIGPKTARFICLYCTENAQCVPLDVHILRWLGAQGYSVPKNTPSGREYSHLESAFVSEAAVRNMSVLQLDTHVWREGART